ncbi:hypothetical protein HanPI659440_Chr02g0036171 [Helianthus annuus]|nr:hypothetical protein HanPI659440_Chr02g0036171 [Helianthus annuus]
MQITEITFSIIQRILTTGDEEYGKFYKPYATSIVQFLKIAICATSGLDYFHNKSYNQRLRSTYSMRLRKTSGPLKPPYGYTL